MSICRGHLAKRCEISCVLSMETGGFPMRTVVYPGSFDPLTNGHLDVVVVLELVLQFHHVYHLLHLKQYTHVL